MQKRRVPRPQVEVQVKFPHTTFAKLKAKGFQGGYIMKNGHLWLRGTVQQIKAILPTATIIKSVGQ